MNISKQKTEQNLYVEMESINSDVDISKLFSDFEKNMAESGESTNNGIRVMDEVQLADNNALFNIETYQRNQPSIINTTTDVDFKIDSPYLKLKKKIHRLDSTNKSMRKEMYEIKKVISDLKEEISNLHNKLDNGQKYRKNSVMGQLGIIREILINMQTKPVQI